MSLRDELLASREAKTITVTPSFFGKPIEIIMLSVGARRDLIKQSQNDAGDRDAADFEALVVIATARDPVTKKLIFQPADKDALVEWPALDLDELAAPALELNGLLVASHESALKNSTPTPSSSANTDSPNGSA